MGRNVAPCGGVTEVDAGDGMLAPGFIDIHSHADFVLPLHPEGENLLLQGVTTIVMG